MHSAAAIEIPFLSVCLRYPLHIHEHDVMIGRPTAVRREKTDRCQSDWGLAIKVLEGSIATELTTIWRGCRLEVVRGDRRINLGWAEFTITIKSHVKTS